ncbi:hypothetical protein M9H77_14132 [Catharanthus roseus]|uniref:Uncharacterized protein n=1 Tax=Catharanthus roseus TaxID=4058 RepID=A0ACC0BME8_CATRO|nr:hypothetical protein M9H77_14132 [Catharanthus roseus]
MMTSMLQKVDDMASVVIQESPSSPSQMAVFAKKTPLPPGLGFASFQALHSTSYGFSGFWAPAPPGTASSSTPHQPISQVSSSDEEERADDMDGVQYYGFGHRIVQQWESSQWFSNARYDYTHSGAFLDIGSGSPIDDLVKSGTVRLLDWNNSMTDIQLGMRYVDKVQAISAVLANDLEIPVLNIIQEVQVLFQTSCTYKRTWYARKFTIERVFGSWDTTFNILPKYLQAVQDLNPRIVYEFLHHRTSSSPNYVFKFVFLYFSPCIDGYSYCRLVISVDGTHLRGLYKGILLIARILRELELVCENTLSKIGMYASFLIATKIQERNVDVYIYLTKLDPEKWTLLYDGGHRHGIMTTNISEALNTLVELIFNKLVKYFHQHREEAENYVHPFPTRIFDKFMRIEIQSREHKVTTYNPREGIYMVRSPIWVSGTGNNVYILRLNNKSCSCEKWQTYTLPCSHVLAVCRENGTRTDIYVPEIYSRQMYRRTY